MNESERVAAGLVDFDDVGYILAHFVASSGRRCGFEKEILYVVGNRVWTGDGTAWL
jgi:hypothetical protein